MSSTSTFTSKQVTQYEKNLVIQNELLSSNILPPSGGKSDKPRHTNTVRNTKEGHTLI